LACEGSCQPIGPNPIGWQGPKQPGQGRPKHALPTSPQACNTFLHTCGCICTAFQLQDAPLRNNQSALLATLDAAGVSRQASHRRKSTRLAGDGPGDISPRPIRAAGEITPAPATPAAACRRAQQSQLPIRTKHTAGCHVSPNSQLKTQKGRAHAPIQLQQRLQRVPVTCINTCALRRQQ
jgi:hypothetical protein